MTNHLRSKIDLEKDILLPQLSEEKQKNSNIKEIKQS
jgi:hypothetical protein